jgi:hypothetical protein
MEEMRKVYKILVGKPDRKRPLRRPRCTWEDNIKIDLWKIGLGGVSWIHLAQDNNQWQALVNTVMTFRFHKRQGIS